MGDAGVPVVTQECLIRYGAGVEVLSPPSLREKVKIGLEQAAGQY